MSQYSNNGGAPRRKLSDIVNGGTDSLRSQWNKTEAAADFGPLPPDTYIARVVGGELFNAKTETPGYKLTLRVIEGEFAGRPLWIDIWLTELAMPMAKRDLGKLGITSIDQLEAPLRQGIRCSCKVKIHRNDDGIEFNHVQSFEVIGIDADPAADEDFAPEPSKTDEAEEDAESDLDSSPDGNGGAA